MIVVTAPTGKIGHHVVNDLLEADAKIRVVVRDAGKMVEAVRNRVEVIEGSHGDRATIDRALDGATALFWLAPPDAAKALDASYLDFTRPAADAIRRQGVERVVSVTALGRGTRWQDGAGLVTASIGMDDLLMETGAAFRGLAMPSFMDNVLRQAAAIRDEGTYTEPYDPDAKYPTTATRDMGGVAADLLADREWSGQQELAILGPEDLSPNEMVAIMSETLGWTVRYRQTSLDTVKQQMLTRGASESFAQGYADMYRAKIEGMDNAAEQGRAIRTPTTFRSFCETALKPATRAKD